MAHKTITAGIDDLDAKIERWLDSLGKEPPHVLRAGVLLKYEPGGNLVGGGYQEEEITVLCIAEPVVY